MPPRAREFAVLCVLLVALHVGAVGLLWVEGGSVTPPPAETADASADAETLLLAAAHNDAVLPMTSEATLRDPANGTTVLRYRIAVDPRAGRARVRWPDTDPDRFTFRYDEVYLTPWGSWARVGDEWGYIRQGDRYRADDYRVVSPDLEYADRVRKRTHDDGTVTVLVDGGLAGTGILSFAGENATLRYRIAFDDGRPYVARATGESPDENGIEVTVERRRGADVQRPEDVPPMTAREVRDRLVSGGVHR